MAKKRAKAQTPDVADPDLLRVLMDSLPDAIYFKDRESRFIRINKACAEWMGLAEPAAGVGKTDFDVFTEEHARQAVRRLCVEFVSEVRHPVLHEGNSPFFRGFFRHVQCIGVGGAIS